MIGLGLVNDLDEMEGCVLVRKCSNLFSCGESGNERMCFPIITLFIQNISPLIHEV